MDKSHNVIHLVTVSLNMVGQRIDNFLLSYVKGVSKNKIYKIIRKGSVRVNKKRIKWTYKLQHGDVIRIPVLKNKIASKVIDMRTLQVYSEQLRNAILFEDDSLVVLNKPSGMSVHGGNNLDFDIITGLRLLRPELNFLELVHRLDRDTSGILLLAKNRFSLIQLHEQFRLHIMKKEYLALLFGTCSFSIKTVVAPIFKYIFGRRKYIVKIDSVYGKYSETCFMVHERFTIATLVKVTPITGRTHQIRIHAQHIGNPIMFDKRYGNFYLNDIVRKFINLNRLFLHASSLTFIHPETGKYFNIQAPMDKLLLNCLLVLRKCFSI